MVNYYDWRDWNEMSDWDKRNMLAIKRWRDKSRMYLRTYRYYLKMEDVAPGSLLSVKLAFREAYTVYRRAMKVCR